MRALNIKNLFGKSVCVGMILVMILPLVVPGKWDELEHAVGETSPQQPGDIENVFDYLPLQFIENSDLVESERYPLAQLGGSLLFGVGEVLVRYSIPEAEGRGNEVALDPYRDDLTARMSEAESFEMPIEYVGGNKGVQPRLEGRLPGTASIYSGNDPAAWQSTLATYIGVRYAGLYPGIDLVFSGENGGLKSTFEVEAGSDPGAIRWQYPEEYELEVNPETGDLHVLRAGSLILVEKAPEAWQVSDGERTNVPASYRVDGTQVAFDLSAYDAQQMLYIDPVIEISTYIGDAQFIKGVAIEVDAEGYIYLTGQYQNYASLYIVKIDYPNKAFVYTTLISGNANHRVSEMDLDETGQVYITGYTDSTNFPTTPDALQTDCTETDVFVTKLDAAGNVAFSTYFCGSSSDFSNGIRVDAQQNVIFTGSTLSADLPCTAGAFDPTYNGDLDGFVAKINTVNPSCSFTTFLGGSALDNLHDIQIDDSGFIYVLGNSNSANYPKLNALASYHAHPVIKTSFDIVLTKLAADGSALIFSTYLGGTHEDYGVKLALDEMNHIYLVGRTASEDFPLVNALQTRLVTRDYEEGEGFLMKLNTSGSAILFSTYYSGYDKSQPYDINVDNQGTITILKRTDQCMPLYSFKNMSPKGAMTGFVGQINAAGEPTYHHFLVASGRILPSQMAIDGEQNLYITGETDATNFPMVNAFSTTPTKTFLVKVKQFNQFTTALNLYLPMMYNPKATPKGIHGWVTEWVCGVAGIPLELRFYNGSFWTTKATTTTKDDGSFSFPYVTSLQPGQLYYVRYTNQTDENRVWIWSTGALQSYLTGQDVMIGNFDIHTVAYGQPEDGASIYLPYTFTWGQRYTYLQESYDFNMFEYYGNDFWYTPPLGEATEYTMTSLPEVFNTNEPHFWYVGIHGPLNGYGEAFYARLVYFNDRYDPLPSADLLPEALFEERLERIEEMKLQEAQLTK